MEIEKIADNISSFLIRQNINNRIENIVKSVQLDIINVKILNTVKIKKLLKLTDDIAFLIGIQKVTIKTTDIPNVISILIPKTEKGIIYFKDLVKQKEFKENKEDLKFLIGQDLTGRIKIGDLGKMTHLLVAGQTGSGKSVFLNNLISSMMTNKNVQFIMIDIKKVELSIYQDLKNLLFPVATNVEQAIVVLNWVVTEMNKRYSLLVKENVRNITEYNSKVSKNKQLKKIVVVIDELADLMMTSSRIVENLIVRIAQLARASGIHLVIATQRPSYEVITGLIKANLPTKIAFAVSTKINSRVILDEMGAENLLGKGDMLLSTTENIELQRVQGSYISNEEIREIIEKVNGRYKNQEKEQDILLSSVIDYLKNKKDKTVTDIELQEIFKLNEKQVSDILLKLESMNYVGEFNLFAPRYIYI